MQGAGGHTAFQRRSTARTAVVWEALREILERMPEADVLDIGGGTGELAVRVAELGHRVTVVDPSPDALAILDRRAEERGVADRVTGLQGELAGLPSQPGVSSDVDVVVCHGVLEMVEDAAAAMAILAGMLRPGGALSLVVAQRHAAVVTRAMAGHFGQAKALLDGPARIEQPGSHARFTAEEVTTLLADAGFGDVALHAVRVFVDLVPSSLVDLEPGAAEALMALEQAVAQRPEYLTLATQIHAVAVRPVG